MNTMLRKLVTGGVLLALLGVLVFWFLTMPNRLDSADLASISDADLENGERVFWAGGCASCHSAPKSKGPDRLVLAGGLELATPFGTFVAPNISQNAVDGIGAWTKADFANAMMRGVSPDGRHYYPAFPFTSYARMDLSDIGDLFAFLKTLPDVAGAAPAHKLGFPFNIRRALGLWKLLYLNDSKVVALDGADALAGRGQYLVEGPGHCGECHTPRNPIGGTDTANWLAGAVAAEGDGKVPNITTGEGGIGDWSANDIAYYLETGFTPEFDAVGGAMVDVQQNMAQLPAEDRQAIAAYLKSIPPRPNGW
jgi:mono/diheme cytochrome c family protein